MTGIAPQQPAVPYDVARYLATQQPVIAYPVQRTWVALENPTADELNQNVRDAVNWLLSPPRAVVYQSNSQDFQDGANTTQIAPLQLDTPTVDTDRIWTQDFPSRMYCNTPGLYRVRVETHFNYTATVGTYHTGIALNTNGHWPFTTNNKIAEDTRTGSGNSALGTSLGIRATVQLNIGDYVEFFAAQAGTGTDVSTYGGIFGCVASMRMLSQF